MFRLALASHRRNGEWTKLRSSSFPRLRLLLFDSHVILFSWLTFQGPCCVSILAAQEDAADNVHCGNARKKIYETEETN